MTSKSFTVHRWAAGTLAVAGFVCALAGVAYHASQLLINPESVPGLWELLLQIGRFLSWPAFAGLGVLILWLSSRQSGALFGIVFLSIYTWWGLVSGNVSRDSSLFRPLIQTCDFLFHTSALRFAQLFPRPLRREDVLALGTNAVTKPVTAFLAALLEPRVFWPAALVFEARALAVSFPPIYTAHVLVVSLMATTYFYAGYRRGSEEERQRIFWLMEAAVVFVAIELAYYAMDIILALGIFDFNPSAVGPWLHLFMIWATFTCIALAIFHKGAFDSRLVVRRTTVASLTGALAVVIFITMETAVTETLEVVFGFQSRIGTIAGGAAVALLLKPITDRIDRKLGGKGKVVAE